MIPLLCRGAVQLTNSDEEFHATTVGAASPSGTDSAVVTDTALLLAHEYTVHTSSCITYNTDAIIASKTRNHASADERTYMYTVVFKK